MLGLFGTLNLSSRSMQVQQQGIEVAGHNMANVNNPAYARQRIAIQTAPGIASENGIEGTGSDTSRISQIRDVLLDVQINAESSVTGSLEAQQRSLQYAQADLGQQLDRAASGAEGAAAAAQTGTQHGIGDSISDLFSAFQNLSTQPTSETERDIVLTKAATLADKFQQTDQRLSDLQGTINKDLGDDVAQANGLLQDVARLNQQIGIAEVSGAGAANDLRDTRQAKLEELSKLMKFDTSEGNSGSISISVGGVPLVDSTVVTESLETYDAGNGQMLVRGAASGTPINPTSGSIHGEIEVRDGAIQTLRDNLSNLASALISEVNQVHQSGFGLDGTTGLNFFDGTDAKDIHVNSSLMADHRKLQASSQAGASKNNAVAVALAQLQNAPQTGLQGQTFSQNYSRVVAGLGESLSKVNEQITDQTVVSNMLKTQRDSMSGVSLDEEMTDLMKYQKAYQASAQMVNVINEMLDTVLNMMR
jgi:flagellar hook-associated protein 1 FlgK